MIKNYQQFLNEKVSGITPEIFIKDSYKLLVYLYPNHAAFKNAEILAKELGDSWRLPSREELKSIIINMRPEGGWYWTSERTKDLQPGRKSVWSLHSDTVSAFPKVAQEPAFLDSLERVILVKDLTDQEIHDLRGTIQGKKYGL